MTKEEKIIATAFTGKMFIDGSDMGLLYEYMEKKVGHGVIDLMLADKGFWEELHKACEKDFIDMVSKEQPCLSDNLIEVPRWFVETIENTLRIQNNINLDKKTGETCQDRNIREVLNGVRKLLNGEELTGMERLEKLQPSLLNNLDEAAKQYDEAESWKFKAIMYPRRDAFKAGAEWMAKQMNNDN